MYFGLGLIPKAKLKMAETTFQRKKYNCRLSYGPPKTKLMGKYWRFLDYCVYFQAFQNLYPRCGKTWKKVSVLIPRPRYLPRPVFCFAEVFKLHYELFGKSKKCTINSISVPTSARRELNVSTLQGHHRHGARAQAI